VQANVYLQYLEGIKNLIVALKASIARCVWHFVYVNKMYCNAKYSFTSTQVEQSQDDRTHLGHYPLCQWLYHLSSLKETLVILRTESKDSPSLYNTICIVYNKCRSKKKHSAKKQVKQTQNMYNMFLRFV